MARYRVRLSFPSERVVWKTRDPYEVLGAVGGHAVQGGPFVITPTVEADSPEDAVRAHLHLVQQHWPDDIVTVTIEPRRFRVRVAGPVPARSPAEAMEIVARLDTYGFLVNSPAWTPDSDGSAWTVVQALDEVDAHRQAEAIASRLPGWSVSEVSPAD